MVLFLSPFHSQKELRKIYNAIERKYNLSYYICKKIFVSISGENIQEYFKFMDEFYENAVLLDQPLLKVLKEYQLINIF